MTKLITSLRIVIFTFLFLAALAGQSLAQVDVTMKIDMTILQGTASTEAHEVLLYAPDPIQQGSSISHWDTSATPNLLMEPNLSADLPFLGLDITPALMEDIGWGPGESNFNVVDIDAEGEGFTDMTPFEGAPGNPATTLGEARLNLFTGILNAWGETLGSPVDIDVLVTWQPLPCTEGQGAVLAAAGATEVISEDGPAEFVEFADTWYPIALAESIAGVPLNEPADENGETGGDIIVILNRAIDAGCLAEGTGFYYGFDNDQPSNLLNFSTVVLHELAHGLGMSNFTDETTGRSLLGLPSVYDHFTYDLSYEKNWAEMTPNERISSARNDRRVIWSGSKTTEMAATTLTPGTPVLEVAAPQAIAGGLPVGTANFAPPLDEQGVAGALACTHDGFSGNPLADELPGNPLDACEPLLNSSELEGKIALIERGNCSFSTKVTNAESAGAVGAVIINEFSNSIMTMNGATTTSIPTVLVGRKDGKKLRSLTCPEVPAALFTQWIDGDINGRSNSTRFILRNSGSNWDSGEVILENSEGDLGFPFIPFGLAPNGVSSFETFGQERFRIGIGKVRSYLGTDSHLTATAILEVLDGSVTVSDSPVLHRQQLYVSFRDDERTGVSLYNPDPVYPAIVEIILREGQGIVRETTQVMLRPGQQLRAFLDEEPFFQNFFLEAELPFEGSAELATANGEGIAALGLIQKSDGTVFATPAMELVAEGEGLTVLQD